MKNAVVNTNNCLLNLPASFGERLQKPLERLTPNPKLKFMEQCREVVRFDRLVLRNVSTTQIYTHVVQKPVIGVRSPLDGQG